MISGAISSELFRDERGKSTRAKTLQEARPQSLSGFPCTAVEAAEPTPDLSRTEDVPNKAWRACSGGRLLGPVQTYRQDQLGYFYHRLLEYKYCVRRYCSVLLLFPVLFGSQPIEIKCLLAKSTRTSSE